MTGRDLWLLVLALGGLVAGLLWPSLGLMLSPWTAQMLMVQFFLSFLFIDVRALASLKPADLAHTAAASALKLLGLPVLMWLPSSFFLPEEALAVLLLSGVSTGVTAPFLAVILGANANRLLLMTIVTSALCPLTLPGLVSVLAGKEITIPYSHMAGLLGLIMGPPAGAVFLLRRLFPSLAFSLRRLSVPVGLPLLFFINLSVIAPFAGFVRSHFSTLLFSAGLATALCFIYALSGLGLALLRPRRDGLSSALGLTCINNVLVAVFAARFFGPQETLLAVAYMFPFFLFIIPFSRLVRHRQG